MGDAADEHANLYDESLMASRGHPTHCDPNWCLQCEAEEELGMMMERVRKIIKKSRKKLKKKHEEAVRSNIHAKVAHQIMVDIIEPLTELVPNKVLIQHGPGYWRYEHIMQILQQHFGGRR